MNFSRVQLLIIGSLLLSFTNVAVAESFFIPALCDSPTATLSAKNVSNEDQAFWVQLKNPEKEIRFEFAAKTDIQIPLQELLNKSQAFAIHTWTDRTIEFTWVCETKKIKLYSQVSPLVEYKISATDNKLQLHLMNVSILKNDIQLRFLKDNHELLTINNVSLENYYETQLLDISPPSAAVYIQIVSQNRLHTWLMDSKQMRRSPIGTAPVQLRPEQNKKYFLVSTKTTPTEESFIMAIKSPEMIKQARQQIKSPQLEKIIVARIEAGNGGHNRSYHDADHSPYSWSVSEVDSFTDFALNDCDGTPDTVENQLSQRLNDGGRICFWRYRVIRELTLQEVQRGY